MGRFSERYKREKEQKNSFGRYLDLSKYANIGFYKPPKNGHASIDIVPYIIKTDKHPMVKAGRLEIGDMDFMFDIWVHRSVGPTEIDCVCLKKNYGQPCPICEYAEERLKKYSKDDDEYRSLKAKQRVCYNIIDATESKPKLMWFEISHYLFHKELKEKAMYIGSKRGEDILNYADPDEGYTIEFRTSVEQYMGNDTIRFKDFSFEERDYVIPDDLIKKAVSFDDCLIMHSYDEMSDILYGRGVGSAKEDDEEDEISVMKKTKKKKKALAEEEQDNNDKEDDDVPMMPKKKKSIEEEPEEKTDQKPRKKERKKDKQECPHGLEFGVDCDEYEDCDECDIWEQCHLAQKED